MSKRDVEIAGIKKTNTINLFKISDLERLGLKNFCGGLTSPDFSSKHTKLLWFVLPR